MSAELIIILFQLLATLIRTHGRIAWQLGTYGGVVDQVQPGPPPPLPTEVTPSPRWRATRRATPRQAPHAA